MIKLIDIRIETEEDVQFGTCELCFSVGDLDVSYFVFQDDTGTQKEVEAGYWSWGDYIYLYYIENTPRFAEFLGEQGKELNFSDFDEVTCDCGCQGEVFNLESWFNSVYQEYKEVE